MDHQERKKQHWRDLDQDTGRHRGDGEQTLAVSNQQTGQQHEDQHRRIVVAAGGELEQELRAPGKE